MFFPGNKYVLGMGLIRILSAMIELTAALLILKWGNIQKALKINAILAMVGPTILLIVMVIGLWGLTEKFSLFKLMILYLGVFLIFLGLR